MNFFRIAFELFALYMLYKLVFDFIIPITKTTREVKKQFGDMHSQMQEKMTQFNQQQAQQANSKATSAKSGNEDYIEFEEVK